MLLVEKYTHRSMLLVSSLAALGFVTQGAVAAYGYGAWRAVAEFSLIDLFLCAPLVVCSAYLFLPENH